MRGSFSFDRLQGQDDDEEGERLSTKRGTTRMIGLSGRRGQLRMLNIFNGLREKLKKMR